MINNINDLNNTIEKINNELEEKKKINEDLKNEKIQLENQIKEKDKIINQIDKKEKIIQELKLKIDSLEKENNNYKNNINKTENKNEYNNQIQNIELDIKEKIEKMLKEKYDGLLQEEINKIKENINKRVNKTKDELEKKYKEKYEKKENERDTKFEKIINEIINKYKNNNDKTTHKGIKCQECLKEPIVGCRYKCSICKDYNLCEKCEEKISFSCKHLHNFIKIRKEELIDKNNKSNNIKNDTIDNNSINESNSVCSKDENLVKSNILDIKKEKSFTKVDNIDDKINGKNPITDENLLNIKKAQSQKEIIKKDNKDNIIDKIKGKSNIKNNINDNSNRINNLEIKKKHQKDDKKNNNPITEKSDNNQDINRINKDIQYSYEITNIISLSSYIYEGTEETSIEIILKNNGEYPWPLNSTKLICDKESKFIGNEIKIDPLNKGEEKKYKIIFKNLEKNPIGEYVCYYWFYANGKPFGEKITLRINIKEKGEEEIEKYKDKIKEFRDNYDLSVDEYSDERLLECLKENEFEFEATFGKLF